MATALRVLIVEDSEDDALLLVRALKRGGLDRAWRRVDDARELAASLDTAEWDCVLSDYTLPTLDAPTALSILKGRGLDVPFLIVSRNVGEDVAVAAMKAGAHDYIMKGNLARLVPAIEREIRDAHERETRRRADGHHRAEARRGAAPPRRLSRRADRAAEPGPLPRPPRACARAEPPARRQIRGPLRGPRPLQDGQRRARARRGRLAARRRLPAAARVRPSGGHARPLRGRRVHDPPRRGRGRGGRRADGRGHPGRAVAPVRPAGGPRSLYDRKPRHPALRLALPDGRRASYERLKPPITRAA